MTQFLPSAAAVSILCLAAVPARAQAPFEGVITFRVTELEGNPTQLIQTSKGRKLRFDGLADGVVLLLDPDAGRMVVLTPGEMQAMVLTYAEMEQFAELNQAMGVYAEGGDGEARAFTNTGRTEMIAGAPCSVWTGSTPGGEVEEVCVAEGLGWDARAMLSNPMLGPYFASDTPGYRDLLGANRGILKVTTIESGTRRVEIEATRIERKPVEDAAFSIPQGYTEASLADPAPGAVGAPQDAAPVAAPLPVAVPAPAGSPFEGVVAFRLGHRLAAEVTQSIKGGKLRLEDREDTADGPSHVVILDADAGQVVELWPAKRRMRVYNRAEWAKYSRTMGRLDRDGRVAGYRRTTQTELVAGVECEVWALRVNTSYEEWEEEVCLAVGVGLARLDAIATTDVRRVGYEAGLHGALVDPTKGILKITRIENGTREVVLEAIRIERTAVADSIFVPRGYAMTGDTEATRASLVVGPPLLAEPAPVAAPATAESHFDGVIIFLWSPEDGVRNEVIRTTKGGKLRRDVRRDGRGQSSEIIDSDSGLVRLLDVLGPGTATMLKLEEWARVQERSSRIRDDRARGFHRTTRAEMVAGVPCEVWSGFFTIFGKQHVDFGATREEEACLADGVGLTLRDAISEEIAARYREVIGPSKGILKVVVIEHGSRRTELEATRIERTAVADSTFAIPVGYRVTRE